MVSTAILQTFLINGSIMMMFLFWGYKIIARKRTRISLTLAGVFIIPAIGLFINILYRGFDNLQFNIIGNILTISLTIIGILQLFFFNQILFKSQKAFTLSKQFQYIGLFLVLLLGLFLIGIFGGVQWQYDSGLNDIGYSTRLQDPLDVGVPVWSLAFCIYGLVISQSIAIAVIFSGFRLFKQMGGKSSKYSRKFIYSIIGILLMDLIVIGNFIFNTLNNPTGRTILLIVSITIIPAGFLLYAGLKEEKQKI
ncbi:hypothetical protein NEF87_002987 [Candidatus Lokiarchaeum ossiferum]|uniref:Uncharacterized protein n=1 Tax=Candidatus Lokiarchaeum ossiferum TaxID=2951803 RepID=A0ABY6HWG7_9ARCH|nr:hypothetical protein NEF87_002987 [Candidatus Lokiarchaeum sp. B-35]